MPVKKHVPDDLFLLIKSLSKAEKRYFKVFATGGDDADKSYMQLFDVLNEMEEYNEQEVKKILKGKRIANNLHVAKKYLFELILKSLVNFHAESNEDFKIKMQLLKIDILNRKNLFDLVRKNLKRAEVTAFQHNKKLFLLEIYALMKNNVVDLSHQKHTSEEINEIIEKEQKVLAEIDNKNAYKSLMLEVSQKQINMGSMTPAEVKATYAEILKHPLLQDEKSALSLDAKVLFHNINGYLKKDSGMYEESMKHFKRFIALIENELSQKTNYIIGLYNYAILLSETGGYTELEKVLKKAYAVTAGSAALQLRQFKNHYQLILSYYNNTGQFNEAIAIENEALEGVKKYKVKLDEIFKLRIYFYLAYAHFGVGNYDVAIRYVNEIINEPKIESSMRLFLLSKMLLMMIHFEQRNIEVSKHVAESIIRAMKKRKMQDICEYAFCDFFANLKRMPIQDEWLQLDKEWKTREKNATTPPFVTEYMELEKWILSKVNNKPYKEVLREKLKKTKN